MPDGVTTVAVGGNVTPPEGATLYHGYDYENQYWVYEGKRDTRTLEEIKNAL